MKSFTCVAPRFEIHNTRQQKKSLFIWISRSENVQRDPQTPPPGWFPQIFVLTQAAGWLKSRILPFLTFLAYRAHDCSNSGAVPWVLLDRMDSSAPSYIVGSTRKSVHSPRGGCENTICSWGIPRKLWKLEKFRFFSIIFEASATGNTDVGLLWGIWIEPSLPNTPMLLIWPENHFGVVYPYPEKMMINLSNLGLFWSFLKSMRRAILLRWNFVGRYESSHPPPHPYAMGSTWDPLWSHIFSDFFFVLFLRLDFHYFFEGIF